MTSQPLGRTAVRPSWDELPIDLRDALTERLGGIHSAQVQGGGFTPGVAARLSIAGNDRVFVKAIRNDHALAGKYRTEAEAASRLPVNAPTPRLRWHGHLHGWVVLIFDDVAGRHPDLSPGSADVAIAVTGVAGLAKILTPNPLPDAPLASVVRGEWLHGWADLQRHSDTLGGWERANLPRLARLESTWTSHADGPSLIHGDIRPDNLLIRDSDDALIVVDWAQPCRGAAWQDVADLIPHLIMAGHDPEQAEKAVTGIPAWDELPSDAITSYAAAYAGYWTRMSREPSPSGVPNLRAYQAVAAKAAIKWVEYRTS